MDYDVVRTNFKNINFKRKDDVFCAAMEDFHKEGIKQPTLSKVILSDYTNFGQKMAESIKRASSQVSEIYVPVSLANISGKIQEDLNKIAIGIALKRLDADEVCDTSYMSPKSSQAETEFNRRWNELYPKTGSLRNRILNANRLTMKNVTPKANWADKISYAKTIGEYKKDYPKTFMTRFLLISDKQITEEKTTKRISNIIKRFIYRSLIKNKFSFKK